MKKTKVFNPAVRDAARALNGIAKTMDVIAEGHDTRSGRWSRAKSALVLTATHHFKVVDLLVELADQKTLNAVIEVLREPSFRNRRLSKVAYALTVCANTVQR